MAERRFERQLISRTVAQDEHALTELLWNYYDRLAAHVAPQIPDWLQASVGVDDILQETFTVAWQKVSQFSPQGPDSFYQWLKTIAQRKLVDKIRTQRRAKRGGGQTGTREPATGWSESLLPLLEVLAGDGRTPSSEVAGHEAELELHCALIGLADNYQRVLQLRYLEGLTVAAVADRMNCSVGSVHMLASRAIKKLRKSMGSASRYFDYK